MLSRMPGCWLNWWSDPTSHDDKPCTEHHKSVSYRTWLDWRRFALETNAHHLSIIVQSRLPICIHQFSLEEDKAWRPKRVLAHER